MDSNELINDRLIDLSDRSISTTKFPRIGRSLFDSEETPSDDFQFVDQRSVLFPRIGKRAFHNLLWANSRSNPHRMLDSQGRSSLNGYDYNINPIPSKSTLRYRIKRNSFDVNRE